jgi:hypothetical protein
MLDGLMHACLAAMALAPLLAIQAHASDETCFHSWSEAAQIVRKEGLVSTHDVYQKLLERRSVEVLRITLCREGDRFVYKIVVRQTSGRLINQSLDARHPFER